MKKGLWICVTGLDGTGKTGLKHRLGGHFRSQNLKVKDFKFPYDKHLLELLNNTVGDGVPWKDNYSDQMLFALDNRIVGTVHVRDWRETNDVLISQRGYIDSFVHGECRGFTYQQVDELQRTDELQKCDVMIHLNADPVVAFNRIKDDPDGDKFETLEYIQKQAEATERAYNALVTGTDPALSAFKRIPNIYIDTTSISMEETFEIALEKLRGLSLID